MITFLFLLWFDPASKRKDFTCYGVEHVHLLRRQIERNITLQHAFVVMSPEEPAGLEPGVRWVALDRRTMVPGKMFAKLNVWRPDIGESVGKRIFYMDLDTVVVGNLDHVAGRTEPLVLWAHPKRGRGDRTPHYNSSFILLDAGSRLDIWERFHPVCSPAATRAHGFQGDDQDWVSYCVGPGAPVWTADDGVYWWREIRERLPKNAALVTYPGRNDPAMARIRAMQPWIARHQR